jgi:hypothetical protein
MTGVSDNWRPSLIESLGDTDVTRSAFDQRLTRDVLVYIGVLIFVVGPLISLSWAFIESDNSWLGILLFPVVMAVAIGASTYGLRLVVRVRSGNARDRLLSDPRRPVLYLRSFIVEEALRKGTSAIEGPEETLVARLSRIGPVIAVGRPGESLPPMGAARFYPTDAEWQAKVAEICAAAQFVVWMTGKSPGLSWELRHILTQVPIERVIVVSHPLMMRISSERRAAEWKAFQATLGGHFPHRLPEQLGTAMFFHSDSDGQFKPVSPGSRALLPMLGRIKVLHDAVDQLFVAKGLLTAAKVARSRLFRSVFKWIALAGLTAGIIGILVGAENLIFVALLLLFIALFASMPMMARNPRIIDPIDRGAFR